MENSNIPVVASTRNFAFVGLLVARASSNSSEQLTGVVERIIFFNEENHYTIAEFRPDPKNKNEEEDTPKTTIVGALPGVECGETLHLSGEWTRHAQHGAQFKVLAFKSELPASVYGIRKYLGSGLVPGIGKVYANKIVDAFGTDTFRILSEESGRLRDVPGIGKKRVARIKQAWDEKKTERELYIFLQTYGVTPSQCVKLVNRFGNDAKQILMNDPYRIAREIDGIGFKTADRIAINLGFANDAAPRIDAGIIYALETLQEEGHTAFREVELRDHTATLLETDVKLVEARIIFLVENKSLVRHWPKGVALPSIANAKEGDPGLATNRLTGDGSPYPSSPNSDLSAEALANSDLQSPISDSPLPGSGLIQLPHNDRYEQKIAAVIARLAKVNSGLPPIKIDAAVKWASDKAGFDFHALQADAVKNALLHKTTILTGGPGTGKAQPTTAQVLTPNGFRSIGSLKVGSRIITAEGGITKVDGVYPQGEKDVYRITFADGRTTHCCEDHLWRTWTRVSVWSPEKKKKIRARDWRVVPLSYIRRRMQEGRAEINRLAIPLLTDCPELKPRDFFCDPYLIGALIGDGTISTSTQLTTVDPFIHDKVQALIAPLGLTLKPVTLHGADTISYRLTHAKRGLPNPLGAHLRDLELNVGSTKKFIPEIFFSGSHDQRLRLLHGLLDTDGTVDKLGVISFGTSSQQLAQDFQRLAWSLGCIATPGTPRRPTYTHLGRKRKGQMAYTIFLQHPQPSTLLSLPRKLARLQRVNARKRLSHRLRISRIEPAGKAPCVCISVNSPTGLYVTDNYTVTHNTTILRALVDILRAKKVRVHLAAPTGRAANRLAETTGGYAQTIHRLLKFDPSKGGFVANESKPLSTDFLIVDEASMIDTRLASALLQAVPARAHVLLVGDTDQLPSVGAGNVLKDIISTDQVPVTRLSVIYRQKGQSQIVTTAHAINSGDATLPPILSNVADAQVWSDLNFIAATDAEDCVRKVIEICAEYVPQKLKWPHPVNDVQVLAPMHKGIAGVGNFNQQLQTALNTNRQGLRASTGEYRPGDKIIQLRNNYDKNLFNGDIGVVTSIDGIKGTMTADFDGTPQTFERNEFGDLGLAYAISIHKSQGSEYPVVIVPLLKAHFMMLQRNLIYTAITRGRKKVFLVGDPAAYAMAVRNSDSKKRITHLQQKITTTSRS